MLCMDEMTSSEFRKRYASLTAATVVMAGGRPIGQWIPVTQRLSVSVTDGGMTIDPPPLKGQAIDVAYPYEPDSLKVTTTAGERFNSRPFTPVPKKGK